MQNADDESLAARQAAQPQGDCPYLNNTNSHKCGYTFVNWKPNPVWVFKYGDRLKNY